MLADDELGRCEASLVPPEQSLKFKARKLNDYLFELLVMV